MTTFDGRFYNNHLEGEFVLYQHKTLPYAVHTFYRPCSFARGATCNCAVAIKAVDDIITLDRCGPNAAGGRRKPLAIDIFRNDEMTYGFTISQFGGGKKYKVSLPSGTIVIVMLNRNYLNVWVTPSTADYERSEGLCGLYDHDKSNDLVDKNGKILSIREFNKYWR